MSIYFLTVHCIAKLSDEKQQLDDMVVYFRVGMKNGKNVTMPCAGIESMAHNSRPAVES